MTKWGEGAMAADDKKSETVFVVDDNEEVTSALSWLIESIGYHVETYSNGLAFLKNAQFEGPCCAILDVRMPIMGGLELQENLKKEKVAIPVIFLTGHGDIPMTVRAMKEGATEFLTKPVNNKTLLDTIGRAIAQDKERRFSGAPCA